MIEGLFIPEEMRDMTLDKHIKEKLEEYEAVQVEFDEAISESEGEK